MVKLNETEKALMSRSKDVLRRTKKHLPVFLLELPDNRLAYVDVSELMHNKEQLVEALKQLVEQTGSKRYFSIFDTCMVNQGDVKRAGSKLMKELRAANSKAELLAVTKKLFDLTNPPSKNPMAKDALILTTYDKVQGTDLVICSYAIKKNKVVFGRTTKPDMSKLETPYNVWTPVQITLK